MNRMLVVAWKEWRETQAFLWIGLCCFLGLPVIGAIEGVLAMHRRFELFTSPWVMMLGSVFAVLVAVSGTCRDLAPKLEDFWRSRPMGVAEVFGIKFAVGLGVVLAGCIVPLLAELLFNRDKAASVWVVWMPFLWAATYAMAFVVGCVVRRPAHAAMLSLAGMILLYMLPIVVPMLQPLSATTVTDVFTGPGEWPTVWTSQRAVFAAGMASLAVIALLAALLVVWRRWHVETGQRTMYAAIASTLLLVLATAAYRLGTNLPILQQQDLEPGEQATSLNVEAGRGQLLTGYDPKRDASTYLRSVQVTAVGFAMSPRVKANGFSPEIADLLPHAINPDEPAIRYVAEVVGTGGKYDSMSLVVVEGNHLIPQRGINEQIPLWTLTRWAPTALEIWSGRLYVLGNQLDVFDLRDPQHPQLILQDVQVSSLLGQWVETPSGARVLLPPISGLPDIERLRLGLHGSRLWGMGYAHGV